MPLFDILVLWILELFYPSNKPGNNAKAVPTTQNQSPEWVIIDDAKNNDPYLNGDNDDGPDW